VLGAKDGGFYQRFSVDVVKDSVVSFRGGDWFRGGFRGHGDNSGDNVVRVRHEMGLSSEFVLFLIRSKKLSSILQVSFRNPFVAGSGVSFPGYKITASLEPLQ
jgi:hypothetical protein